MKKNVFNQLTVLLLIAGLSPLSQAAIKVVTKSELPADCESIGEFEGDAGYGKSLDGIRIALYRALKKATKAGACHAVVEKLNRGISDQSGYALVEGYVCPHDIDFE